MSHDILVLGSGPAGLAAAVAARGRGKSVLVIGNRWQDSPLARAERVDNYLGLPASSGKALLEQFYDHAAKAGVDVRIITPHIPDKRYVFEVTRAHYPPLLDAGVHIYEYTPGFIHAKNFVVDGRFATVGTVNLDYRSLFLHFEDGVWLCDAPCIHDIERDFQDTLTLSEPITLRRFRHLNILLQLYRSILRVFAPLM